MTIRLDHQESFHASSNRSETDIAYLSYQDQVLLIVVKEDSSVDVGHMEQLLKESVRLTRHRKYYSIVDVRVNAGASAGVIEYYANNAYNTYRYADAFIINTLAMRLLVNFYMSFKKHGVLTKTFTEAESAVRWIEQLKSSGEGNLS